MKPTNKPNTKNKYNKNKRAPKEKLETAPKEKVTGCINDPSYYFNNKMIMDQLTNISFNDFTGVPNLVPSTIDGVLESDPVPYAMRILLNPSAGFTNPEGDQTMGNALNLASLSLYTRLTANNAKTSNYAPQDITMLMLAVGSVISLTSYITRTFGLAYTYNQRNRAYPKDIITVSGVDYDDLMGNFANYRNQFNTLMVSASKLPIPANIAYFKKCSEIYSGVYLDMEGSDMAQSYIMVPKSVWYFDETGSEEGTVLRPYIIMDSVTNVTTMGLLLNNLNMMIAVLLESSTLNAIYSDILRLATKDGMPLYQFSAIPDNYMVIPQFVPEIRLWINNLTIMGSPIASPDEGYTASNIVLPDADTNKIIYRPQFQIANNRIASLLEPYLNFDKAIPTNEEIVSATRLCSTAKWKIGDSGIRTEHVALPDHYVVGIVIYTPNTDPVGITGNYLLGLTQTTRITAFDWAPILRVLDSSTGLGVGIAGDLHYYTTVDYAYLSRLHDASYLGLFEIR